jgi:large subunit ribosomal protein L12e
VEQQRRCVTLMAVGPHKRDISCRSTRSPSCVPVPSFLFSPSPPSQIGEDIAKDTQKDWKGLRITVKLIVQNRQAKIEVVPSAAALVIKALKEPVRDRKKTKNIKHNGNLSLDDVIEVARKMRHRSCAASLAGTVKEMLGTCVSVGCTFDHKNPTDLCKEVRDGDRNGNSRTNCHAVFLFCFPLNVQR